ncbi:hypothetical protein PVAND_008416 [Polypedilum vanderplanki]|uniref:Band 7 domain-containing protein n=1 Tax=Polypedilum vanderplanki TaxID=319348 RepID=A0A9J6C9X6_POLVA|nr:hypothetical protein PVAND_008416 [Polypedilum vanderplanki]
MTTVDSAGSSVISLPPNNGRSMSYGRDDEYRRRILNVQEMAPMYGNPNSNPIKAQSARGGVANNRQPSALSVFSNVQTLSMGDDNRAIVEADDPEHHDESPCGKVLIYLSWLLVCMTMPFSLLVCFKVVQEYERAVIFRLGRLMLGGAKGPGIFFILPCIDAYARVDLRTRTYDVLTKDSVTVSVDAVVYYRVSNATVSIANVENAHHSTRLLAQTTLRNTM